MRLCFLSKPRLMEQRGPTRRVDTVAGTSQELKRSIRPLHQKLHVLRHVRGRA